MSIPPIVRHTKALGKPQQRPITIKTFRKKLEETLNIHPNIIINNIIVAKRATTPKAFPSPTIPIKKHGEPIIKEPRDIKKRFTNVAPVYSYSIFIPTFILT